MPVNKNALLRYRTIDKCLRNHYRKWTLEDLIDACSDALYEYTGKMDPVSKRTVQLDIQKMRSEELGYCAPIIVKENKYYEYEDPDFKITDTPLSAQDMELMSSAVATLKQLSGFSAFSGMEDIVGKLEDHVSAVRQDRQPVMYYESNDELKGLQYLPTIYQAITEKKPIIIRYQSFTAINAHDMEFSPYCLKEFRNRWFVYGRGKEVNMLLNLALDRILSISDVPENTPFIEDKSFNPKTYFDDLIGVTKGPGQKSSIVWFKANATNAPYIETKPLHKSQMVVERCEDGSVIFQIEVVINYELERDLLGYADGVKVLKPQTLVEHMKDRLSTASEQY